MIPFVVGLGAIFAYPVTAIVGIPLFMFFRRHAWLHWWQVSAGGLFAGFVALLALAMYMQSISGGFDYLLLCCGVGLASGLAFWLIAVCRKRALTLVRADAQKAARRST